MFKTNFWEDGVEWNGLVFPQTLDKLNPFSYKTVAVRDPQLYLKRGGETGEVGFDLHVMAQRSNSVVEKSLKQIDRIRALDVPWVKYLVLFTTLMSGAIAACIVALSQLRVETNTLVTLCVVFILALAVTLLFITFLSIQQEEIRDSYRLADLQNKIKGEQEAQLSLHRLNHQLRQQNTGCAQVDQDRSYLKRLNLLRAQSAAWFQQATPSEIIMGRLQETVFENAKFTKRFHSEMVTMKTLEEASSDADKLHILREMFQGQIVLSFFAHPDRYSTQQSNLIAWDNLKEIVDQTNVVLKSDQFLLLVAAASSQALETVKLAFKFRKSDERVALESLRDVYCGLLEKVPARTYERVADSGDMVDKPDAGEFKL